jgi:hypothetical protein
VAPLTLAQNPAEKASEDNVLAWSDARFKSFSIAVTQKSGKGGGPLSTSSFGGFFKYFKGTKGTTDASLTTNQCLCQANSELPLPST